MKAVGGNVVIEVLEKNTTSGVIQVVHDNKLEYTFGNVISKGSLVNEVVEGDHVVFPTHIGKTMKLDGKEYRVIESKYIYAIIED